jgi:hypothetical protein
LDSTYRRANLDIIRLLDQANLSDPTAQHVFDDQPELGWQLAAADVAVVDISAMVYDRLATGKPLLITRPSHEEAQIDTGGYLSDCEWLTAAESAQIVDRLEDLAGDVAAGGRLAAWVQHYFGDTTPGAATARFHGAVQLLMDRWEEHAALHARDDSADPRDADPDDEDDGDDV